MPFICVSFPWKINAIRSNKHLLRLYWGKKSTNKNGKAKADNQRHKHNAGENKFSPFDDWIIHLHDWTLQPFAGFLFQPLSYEQ
jgi:hypothetical protein